MSGLEIDKIYIIYKDLLINKMKIIDINKKCYPLVMEQKYDELHLLDLNKKDIYSKIKESQQQLIFILNSNPSHYEFLNLIDFKTSFDEIDETTLPKMVEILKKLKEKTNKTEEILKHIELLEFLIN
jgi:hypothetical protein